MHEVKSIENLLDEIGHGEILLPEFQRGYVWNRDQVRGLMQSLYHKHPTGHLLTWRTYKPSLVRGAQSTVNGHSTLLLDGQQRLTTLYVLFKGEAPLFYEGESLYFNLHFNMQTEEFRFYQKSRMENNPAWIHVHEFLRDGLTPMLEKIDQFDEDRRDMIQQNLARLSRLDAVRNYTYTVDQVSGDEFSVDQVVEIFNRVNSQGTPLTKADLALAHVCSIWPEAREELRAFSLKMGAVGFGVNLGFLVRCMAGVATGSIVLEGTFMRTPATELKSAWHDMQPAFEHLVGVLRHEAFIGNLSDLPTDNVLVPVIIFLARHNGTFPSETIKRRFVRWFHLAGLWARYSGSTETKLQQDVVLVTGSDLDPTHELEAAILRERGRVALEEGDLDGAGISSAVALLGHVVARSRDAHQPQLQARRPEVLPHRLPTVRRRVVPDDPQRPGVLSPQSRQEGNRGPAVAVALQFHPFHLARLQAHRRIVAGLLPVPRAARVHQRRLTLQHPLPPQFRVRPEVGLVGKEYPGSSPLGLLPQGRRTPPRRSPAWTHSP